MANKREIKKGLAYWADDMLTTICYKNAAMGADAEKASELIVKTVAIKNEFIARANHIDKKDDRKAVRAYFRKFDEDFVEQQAALIEEINKL